ncbi:MarR family winged helix-turn-helix transcriptional regulator [Microbacterium dextranolyticum]|uniref:MarR family transcriptional regulator n=1 Tax=Microbacterium dextranolyticum TaxID=36806 RepID=A0A9W6HN64_9MICO|nr:MarR family transcriptional regulator [Microbacterium dextranolyticum]MBM7462591.1 DNA-binding MarR family transcriptional regulator [Microbacterium dextranolyticum]GLJ96306.1 MarR family transcriptional regulator [Microbacterium dextranolyticum]
MSDRLASSYPDANSSPGLALWRTTNAWQRQVRAALSPHDLTHTQYVLLASLTWMDRSAPVSQRELADHAALDVMMTSQVIRILEAKGYVRREPHPFDGRAFALEPTPTGIELANRATIDVETADTAFFEALSPGATRAFVSALRDLASHRTDGGPRAHDGP